jgi:hypothetical protein
MNFPDDETGHVLEEMQQAGIDLSQQHKVVFFNLFEKEAQAKEMVEFITTTMTEVTVSLHPDEMPNIWDVDCTLVMQPDYEAIIERENSFEQIAEKFKGYNDGWGIEV